MLYYCCVSLERANEIVTLGFAADEFVHVSDVPPSRDRRIGTQAHGVVYFGPPFGFSIADHPSATNEHGDQG